MRDEPKTLREPAEQMRRRSMLSEPHMQPLVEYVLRLRRQKGEGYKIPDFDPLDGGTAAKVLVLLEAPGPKAVDSGFISRNNPDESAKNFFHAYADAGIARRETAVWNVIPWYIGTGAKIRPGAAADLSEAREPVQALFDLFPELAAVILMGEKAKRAFQKLRWRPNVPVFYTLHPSPIVYGTRKTARDEIVSVLKKVKAQLDALDRETT